MSQPSLGGITGLGDREDRDDPTPPVSPFIISEGTSGTANKSKQYTQKSGSSYNRKYQDSSLDADDTESELVAIPESDLSESTLHNSAPGSFDDGIHFDEVAQPLRTDQAKGKVTTANLATAQVALTTIGVTEEKPEGKKSSRLFMKLNSLDKSHDKSLQKSQSSTESKVVTTTKVCSVQEGVRMMVTPSIFMTPQAPIEEILSPEVSVQKAVVVTQDAKSDIIETKSAESKAASKDVIDSGKSGSSMASMLSSSSLVKQIAVGMTKPGNKFFFWIYFRKKIIFFSRSISAESWIDSKDTASRVLGRQKRIAEPSVTSAAAPTSHTITDEKISGTSRPVNKAIDKISEFGSPDSPLTKMNIMPNPLPKASQGMSLDGLLSPKSVTQLEFPTPERLLPIGQHAKEGAATLADKVREVLSISDISHLKQESSFEKSEVTIWHTIFGLNL